MLYVNAHGTSTPLNDRAETNAIKTALGEELAAQDRRSARPSRRSGTCSARPGAVEAIATLLALRDRIAPPTLNYERARRGARPRLRPATRLARSQNGDARAIGLSNAFGFGGHNAVLCLEAS